MKKENLNWNPKNNKIAIFSDVHGNYQALSTIINDIKKRKITDIICLGDTIAIGPNPKECLDLIIDNNVKMVLGNHELYNTIGTYIDDEMTIEEIYHHKWMDKKLDEKERNFLKTCPIKITSKIGNNIVCFQHFIFNSSKDELYPFEDIEIIKDGRINNILEKIKANMIFIGHEHNPFNIEIKKKKLIDVGSSGCTKDDNTFYTILTFNNDEISLEKINIKYDRSTFEKILKNTEFPEKEHIQKTFFGIN